jgi:polyferredoxin
MKVPNKLSQMFRAPKLTRTRIILALAVAVTADGLQFFLGPIGWAFIDQAIDLAALLLTAWVIGFHLLLLPTFVVEAFPVVDMLPTWTACAIAVIALRKREQRPVPPPQQKEGRE